MKTQTRETVTLTRNISRSLATALGLFGIGSGLTLYVTSFPYWERTEAVATLVLTLVCAALPIWLWYKARKASDAQLLKWTIVAAIPLAALCAYGVLAALGALPAAGWSPLG